MTVQINNIPQGWKLKKLHSKPDKKERLASSFNSNFSGHGSVRSYAVSFNGEKNLGEIGPVKSLYPDYDTLRARSWQQYLESDVAQFVLNKYMTWTIGTGLKLQSEPIKRVLKKEKIDLDVAEFSTDIEAYFKTFCESNESTYSGQRNLHHLESRVFINSIIGGDVLCVLRYGNDERITIQAIDGGNIVNPPVGNNFYGAAKDNGNIIKNGIEFSPKGEHVAFYVKQVKENDRFGFDVERIPAKGKESSLVMAFLVVGLEYRLDSKRGLPLISAVMEKLKQLERYQTATIGSAEERAKIPYFIEHGVDSTGENPLAAQMAKILNSDAIDDSPSTIEGDRLADKVAASSNKMVYNLPINSKMVALEAKNEMYFKDFFTVNIDLVCASVEIPPNVAMSKYDANFSASRAALKDWENTLIVKRYGFSCQFWNPIYAFFLEIMILKNIVNAPGYLKAKVKNNWMLIQAYRNARFVGTNVPHIDPMKEVQAERLKLGATGNDVPLTTVEQATEAVNGGEFSSNVEQYARELQITKDLNIKVELPENPNQGTLPPKKKAPKKKAKAGKQ